ncbi:Hpt sensor hybrid histidine kinase [Solidesulfovibrio fructosivorans JJ]]|uniref:histidine kinase n=1 Tax=Solidesulfovibrio fructosivorans JJ] TaxID=596151 RepID=E1JZH2_SOLFR|nr:response regulator [Solidesulfovibrio fructosivorans]EFL50219.1 Hpt sensor hybrid histidine kinase [Solidesulfovibrio fructosivorans JJ]]
MAIDAANDASLLAALEGVTAERDRLLVALREAEAAGERLRGEAQAGMQVKADFMARMTHELRTPLSAIIGLANLAVPLATDPRVRDYLAKITASATGLLGVVDDITDFARLEKGQVELVPVPFDLGQALRRVIGRFATAAKSGGLSLEPDLDLRVPMRLVGDNARLEGVLGHLVGNAVKFTERGSVRLGVELVERHGGRVKLGFTVADTGIGMESDAIPAMLDSFTQADGSLSRPYGGTGLGLALVRRGVELLGGELEVTSRPGQGSRFFFTCPFEEDTAGQRAVSTVAAAPARPAGAAILSAPSEVRPGATGPLAGALILLVEDNSINQQVAREMLERFGAVVDVAGGGREAVEMARLAFYDAVLMDVQMPVMDGLAATRAIRRLPGCGDLPIVALTAHALSGDRQRCLEAGMNDYLTKPIDPARLLAALGQWIAPAAEAGRKMAASADASGPREDQAAAPAVCGLDEAEALERLGGNGQLLASIALEFVRDYATSGRTITRRLAAGDLEGARRLAHTVKGVAGNIAAQALADAARDLEATLGKGELPSDQALGAYAAALAETVEGAARLAPPPQSPPECALTGCWKVLLVDDAKLNRAIFSQILRSAGHEVVTAVNGKDACRALFGQKASGRPFDCILMDIEMPELDGPAATRIIRKLLADGVSPPCPPDIPIMALTSHDAAPELARGLEAGMDGCLRKVFEYEELLAALGRVMEGRQSVPAGATHAGREAVAEPAEMTANLAPLLRRLAAHLAEGSIQADEDVAALGRAVPGRVGAKEMAELRRAVTRYDFAEALEALRRLARAAGLDEDDLALSAKPVCLR